MPICPYNKEAKLIGENTNSLRTTDMLTLKRMFIAALVLCFLFTYIFSRLQDIFANIPEEQARRPGRLESLDRSRRSVRVLFWTPVFRGWFLGLDGSKKRDFLLENCPYRCHITNDRDLLNRSDAVVFHVRDWDVQDVPRLRRPAQKWVWWIMESPEHTEFDGYDRIRKAFNWTMTYRRDSDIFVPYAKTVQRNASVPKTDHMALWKTKSRTAVWLVSNCRTPSRREKYIEELRKHMQVDVHGACGDNQCPMERSRLCYEAFERRYFFILAFENSICRDYVTEKLYSALKYELIPVVFGGANYSALAPPGSYIDALSYSSPRNLAEYLDNVAKNATLYESFFRWKTRLRVEPSTMLDFCPLCAKLHSDDFYKKTSYEDMRLWWQAKGQCRQWMP